MLSTPATADTTLPVDAPAHRTVEYQEVWRTDPYSDEYLMGNITDVVVDTGATSTSSTRSCRKSSSSTRRVSTSTRSRTRVRGQVN
jgi:hypothetical protein